MNREFLGHRGATDVITFELEPQRVRAERSAIVGDIYIAPDVARRNARENGVGVRAELTRLVIHGTLHVLGYTHDEGDATYNGRRCGGDRRLCLPQSFDELIADFEAGKLAALARAVSIVENHRKGYDELMTRLHSHIGRAHRLGITGPPGAGKSTVTNLIVQSLRRDGLTVGVVAVDPTSPFTGGALLGDRVRMESVALDPGVYIRSMATRGSLGGLSARTAEVADVLDAFGFDRIIIETVGVGQTELDIARTADTTVVVLVPESGDSIQTLEGGRHGDRRHLRRQQGRPAGRGSASQ